MWKFNITYVYLCIFSASSNCHTALLPGVIFNQKATEVICIFFKVIENRECGGKHADRRNW